MKADFFTPDMPMGKSVFIVVVTKLVTLQTVDENRERQVRRGIYGFSKINVARHFTKACNDAKGDDIAFLFKKGNEAATKQKELLK